MKNYTEFIYEKLKEEREQNSKELNEIRKKEYLEKIAFHQSKVKEYQEKINNLK